MSLNANDFQAATYGAVPSVRVYNATAFTLTNAVIAPVTMDTEVSDRWGMHSTSSNSERLTVKVPGIYLVGSALQFAANTTGYRAMSLEHYDSGDALRTKIATFRFEPPTTVAEMSCVGKSLVADVGDYFVIRALQTSGGNLDLPAATVTVQTKQLLWAVWQSRG